MPWEWIFVFVLTDLESIKQIPLSTKILAKGKTCHLNHILEKETVFPSTTQKRKPTWVTAIPISEKQIKRKQESGYCHVMKVAQGLTPFDKTSTAGAREITR